MLSSLKDICVSDENDNLLVVRKDKGPENPEDLEPHVIADADAIAACLVVDSPGLNEGFHSCRFRSQHPQLGSSRQASDRSG